MKIRVCLLVTRLSLISLSVYVGLVQASELNTDFLRGISGVPSIFKPGVNYPSGEYYVDVLINGEKTSRMQLTISQADEVAGQLCLSSEWLQS
ncbi:FimD/PapC N-terminal domain-containing protein, partial [Aeromonas jandaei]